MRRLRLRLTIADPARGSACRSRQRASTIIAVILIAVLSSACDLMEPPLQASHAEGLALNLRLYQDNSRSTVPLVYRFWDFDREVGSHRPYPNEKTVPPGGMLYEGELATFDSTSTKVLVQMVPGNAIDRVLLSINGGTGTDARHSLHNAGHKILVMVSQRGLHEDDMRYECPLGPGLVSCLKSASTRHLFRRFNPHDNGRDVVDVLRIIAGEETLTVDGLVTPAADFFAVGDKRVNIETGSYGATILAYALQAFRGLDGGSAARQSGIGRVFIDGPSAPYEHVITDGFRNTRVSLDNKLDAVGLTELQKDAVVNAMKARHTAPVTDPNLCPANPSAAISADCLSSGMIWSYLTNRYESVAAILGEAERDAEMADLKGALIAIPATLATTRPALDAIDAIYRSEYLSFLDRSSKTWESSRLPLTSGNVSAGLAGKLYGFTSRIAHICSAYILRDSGDSQARFDAAKGDTANDPYWYGFLVSYRELLSICPQASAGFRTGIIPPRSLGVTAEAVVQFGAGTDEKHHQQEMDEMAALFAPSTRTLHVFVPQAIQGGETPVQAQRGCLWELKTAAFGGSPGDIHTPVSCLR